MHVDFFKTNAGEIPSWLHFCFELEKDYRETGGEERESDELIMEVCIEAT